MLLAPISILRVEFQDYGEAPPAEYRARANSRVVDSGPGAHSIGLATENEHGASRYCALIDGESRSLFAHGACYFRMLNEQGVSGMG